MRRHTLVMAFSLIAQLSAVARANGRTPATVDIRVSPSRVLASTTFGLTLSTENGPWTWMCESALGFGGTYDPDYELSTKSATFFVNTVDGFRANRDGCTLSPSSLGDRFVSTIAVASNGDVFVATSDNDGSKIYRSTDDGLTFPQPSQSFSNYDSWRSMEIAPGDPTRIYISGIRLVAGQAKQYLMYRSNDAGRTFTPMSTTEFSVSPESVIFVAGISHQDPDLLFARVTASDGTSSDAIYRSTNGGDSWARVFGIADSLKAFVVRRNGEVIAGTPSSGSFRSSNGTDFAPLVGAPRLGCLTEAEDHTLWACTQNYGTPGDDAGVMKSSDATTWTKVLRYQDIERPVPCADGTTQKDTCEAVTWCGTKEQLGITSTSIACASAPDAGTSTDGPSAGGCCGTDSRPTSLLVSGLTMMLLMRRRRRQDNSRQL